jgi:hypothetical protein
VRQVKGAVGETDAVGTRTVNARRHNRRCWFHGEFWRLVAVAGWSQQVENKVGSLLLLMWFLFASYSLQFRSCLEYPENHTDLWVYCNPVKQQMQATTNHFVARHLCPTSYIIQHET